MRLQELFETTEEDRAIISLSSAVYNKLQKYIGTASDSIHVGKIEDMFDTPITALNNVNIDIQAGDTFLRRLHNIPADNVISDKDKQNAVAFWDEDEDTVVINRDYLSTDRIKTTITHELRHALDSVKSNKFPGNGNKYFTPKKKEHRTIYYNNAGEVDNEDPRNLTPYKAQPAEINARFAEVLHKLADFAAMRKVSVAPHLLKRQLIQDFKGLLGKFQIAYLFPEKTKSKDYKRLINRALDFIEKEIASIA